MAVSPRRFGEFTIADRVALHQVNIAKLEGEIDIERARIRALQRQCRHPNKFKTSTMGEMSKYCPDCDHDV